MIEEKKERRARLKNSRRRNRARQRKVLPSTPNWWWTLARRDGRCSSCREPFPIGARIAYDSHSQKVLCEVCADRFGVAAECRQSKAMLRAETTARQGTIEL